DWVKVAHAYLYIGDFARAREAFAKAIQDNPENPECYLFASVTALRNGEYELALSWAQTAARLAPDDRLCQAHVRIVAATCLTAAGERLALAGDTAAAHDCFEAALQLDPGNATARSGMQQTTADHAACPFPGAAEPHESKEETQ
ncbi:MAG: tetratricopeptide repeat protein, partial [Alicyclobacillus sp.]|nr:tetratricopeptide repeat protein [Alicyclobacillus sp.]